MQCEHKTCVCDVEGNGKVERNGQVFCSGTCANSHDEHASCPCGHLSCREAREGRDHRPHVSV